LEIVLLSQKSLVKQKNKIKNRRNINMNNPMSNKLTNPLKNGKQTAKIKAFHEKNLKAAGVGIPHSPLKS